MSDTAKRLQRLYEAMSAANGERAFPTLMYLEDAEVYAMTNMIEGAVKRKSSGNPQTTGNSEGI